MGPILSMNLSIFLNFYGIILLLRSQWSVLLHHAVVNSSCCSYRSHVVVVKSGSCMLVFKLRSKSVHSCSRNTVNFARFSPTLNNS